MSVASRSVVTNVPELSCPEVRPSSPTAHKQQRRCPETRDTEPPDFVTKEDDHQVSDAHQVLPLELHRGANATSSDLSSWLESPAVGTHPVSSGVVDNDRKELSGMVGRLAFARIARMGARTARMVTPKRRLLGQANDVAVRHTSFPEGANQIVRS